MIAAAIFALHFVACIYAFLKYRKDGVGEGILAVAFVIIIFSVGWTITTMLARVLFPYRLVEGWIGMLQGSTFSRRVAKELSIDTFSLLLLTIGEAFFYYYFLRSGKKKGSAGTSGGNATSA